MCRFSLYGIFGVELFTQSKISFHFNILLNRYSLFRSNKSGTFCNFSLAEEKFLDILANNKSRLPLLKEVHCQNCLHKDVTKILYQDFCLVFKKFQN